jgi:flagellar biogenesis protein FliO
MIANTPPFLSTLALALAEQRLGGTQGPDLTRYVCVCGGLLLLVAAFALGFRKWIARAITTRAAQRSLAVVDVLPLGGKQKLAVVRCYDRTFLLGVGEKEIALVSELDAAIEPKRELAPGRADRHAFAQVLERVRGAMAPATADSKGFIA